MNGEPELNSKNGGTVVTNICLQNLSYNAAAAVEVSIIHQESKHFRRKEMKIRHCFLVQGFSCLRREKAKIVDWENFLFSDQ